MTEKETLNIIASIVASYPSYEKLNDAAISGMVKVWQRMFKDDDAKLVGLAVAQHIATSKWPPSVSEIRENLVFMQRPDIIPPDEAWGLVREVMGLNGVFSVAPSETLPPLIRQVISKIGWHNLLEMRRGRNGGYKEGEDKRTFMEFYKPAYERERNNALLPPDVAASLAQVYERNGVEIAGYLDNINKAHTEQAEFYRKLITPCYGDELGSAPTHQALTDGCTIDRIQQEAGHTSK